MGINSCGTTMLDQGVYSNIGTVTWDTTAKTSNFTATSGSGFFVNTTSGAITVTLPSSPSAGNIVAIKDYANTADTNNITIDRNGSNIRGSASNAVLDTEGISIFLVYVDGTQGWRPTNSAKKSDLAGPFIEATGGTITESGDFKIHTFTSPGTFTVTNGGTPAGSNSVDYMVVAGGGSGGGHAPGTAASFSGGGGGAGGFRESHSVPVSGCYTASPLATPTALPVSAQAYPITVGAGGATNTSPAPNSGNPGSDSVFSTITSAGGGGGALGNQAPGGNGGSGGGMSATSSNPRSVAGTGNTPPVSPPQGNNGGTMGNFPSRGSAGGGGAGAAGTNNPSGNDGSPGGAGVTTSINGSPVARAGGGGGGGWNGGPQGSGGSGGGANGGKSSDGPAATANTGGGGGGSGPINVTGGAGAHDGGAGGSGIVIIRYKFK